MTTPISSLSSASAAVGILEAERLRQQKLFELVVEHAPVGIAILGGAEHRYLSVNPAYRPFVAGKGEVLGRTVAEVFPEIAETVVPLLDGVFRTGQDFHTVDMPLTIWREGRFEDTFITFSYTPWYDDAGDVQGVLVLAYETTERKRAEETLRRSETELQAILDNLSEGLVVATPDGYVLQWNHAALEMHGFTSLEEARRYLPEFAELFELSTLDGALLPVEQWPLARVLRGETVNGWEVQVWHRQAAWQRVFSYRGALVRSADEQPLMAVLTIQDVTRRKRAESRLYFQATHDQLTGLPNRALFAELAASAIKSARRKNERVAVMFLDLDHFKPINDAYGHAVGDQVLRAVAGRLRDSLRDCDFIARQGGDEFTLLVSDFTDTREVHEIAERLLHALTLPMTLGRHTCQVTASIGISLFPDDGEEIDLLLQAADAAMYQAKTRRNCIICTGCAPDDDATNAAD